MAGRRTGTTPRTPGRHRRTGHAFGVLAALALALAWAGPARAAQPAISTWPGLAPAFDPGVHDYVTRCQPGGRVWVFVTANGTPVSVDGQAARTGFFAVPVTLSTGQRFTLQTGTGSAAATYNVRCLPQGFPSYTFQRLGQPQAAYDLVTLSSYVALFNSDGVPVWWFRQPSGIPNDADLMPNGDLSWAVQPYPQSFGYPGTVQIEQHGLDGSLKRTLGTAGTPTDFHEALPLPSGDFLIDSYVLHLGGGTAQRPNVLDGTFQEVRPDGSVAYAWSSAGKLTAADTMIWLGGPYPGVSGKVYDWQHLNSVEPYGGGYLISMRDTDALYAVDAGGAIVWKLGGSTTPQSLRIVGDPLASTDFGSQHDARAWPDGTISVYDNGTDRWRPPRVLRFAIDAAAGTATLVQTIADPTVTYSYCCGSARLLPGGNWVVAWGGTQLVDEVTSGNQLVTRLKVAWGNVTYRAVPILPGELSAAALTAGMDAMFPRSPGG